MYLAEPCTRRRRSEAVPAMRFNDAIGDVCTAIGSVQVRRRLRWFGGPRAAMTINDSSYADSQAQNRYLTLFIPLSTIQKRLRICIQLKIYCLAFINMDARVNTHASTTHAHAHTPARHCDILVFFLRREANFHVRGDRQRSFNRPARV